MAMPNDSGWAVQVIPVPVRATPPRARREVLRQPWDVLGVIAAGGSLGSLARYGIALAWPTPAGGFPGATLFINISGCALIGVLMVLITEVWAAHRLVRPFLGTGVLGGFTTFSTYAVDVQRLLDGPAERTGLLYLVATPVTCLAAVWIAVLVTRQVVRRRKAHEAHW